MRVRMLVVALIATPLLASVSAAQGQSKNGHADNRYKVCEKVSPAKNKSGKPNRQPRKCVPDVPPVTPPSGGAGIAEVHGMAFNDLDGNGVYDGSDTPMSGVVVELSGTVGAATTTAADGSYSFLQLPVGNYSVCVTGGRAQSAPSSGVACAGGGFGWAVEVPDFLPSVWYIDQDFGLR